MKKKSSKSSGMVSMETSANNPNGGIQSAKRNLLLVCLESIITEGLMAMPIMTAFYVSLGLNQEQISLTQMAFTVVVMFLNIPAGWVADRFSRKWANVIGDFGSVISLLLYSQAQSFWHIVACEALLGVSLAFSQGVDATLIRHFSHKVSQDESYFKKTSARVAAWSHISSLLIMLIGGPVSGLGFRVVIAASAIPVLIGGILSLFVKDSSERLDASENQRAFGSMIRIIRKCFTRPQLRLRILAYVVSREMTHAIIWCFTPFLLYAGVPVQIVAIVWVLNELAAWIGATIAAKVTAKLADWQKVAIPVGLMAASMIVLSISINIVTVWFYLILGLVKGWTGATMPPLMQEYVDDAEQTSVFSAGKVAAQLLYISVTWGVGCMADIQLNYAPAFSLAVFLPLGVYVSVKLYEESKRIPSHKSSQKNLFKNKK